MSSREDAHRDRSSPSDRVASGGLWRAALWSIAASSIAAMAAISLMVRMFSLPADFPPFQLVPVVPFIAVGVAGAAVALAVINRVSRRPFQLFYMVAAVALLISLIPNTLLVSQADAVPVPGVSVGTMSALGILHAITAVITVTLFSSMAREQRD